MKMPGNMQAMMQQAQKMQQRMQEEIALIRVDASAGGGMVTVHMDGQKHVTGVKIDPEVAGDVEMLQDMVMAAFNETTSPSWIGCTRSTLRALGFARRSLERATHCTPAAS